MDQYNFEELWANVEEALKEGTASGYKMAIIEADKILNFLLKKKRYPGGNIREKLLLAKPEISNFDNLKKAIKIKESLLNDLEFNFNSLDCEETLSIYKETCQDLFQSISSKNWLLIFAPLLRWRKKSGYGKKIFKYFLTVVLFIWFLFGTSVGQSIGKGVVAFFNFLFNWFLIILSLAIGVLLVVVLSFIYFEKRK